jgi:hypothetical protein
MCLQQVLANNCFPKEQSAAAQWLNGVYFVLPPSFSLSPSLSLSLSLRDPFEIPLALMVCYL